MNNLTLKYSKNLKPRHLRNTSPPSIFTKFEKFFFGIIEELFLYKSYYRVFFYDEFSLSKFGSNITRNAIEKKKISMWIP